MVLRWMLERSGTPRPRWAAFRLPCLFFRQDVVVAGVRSVQPSHLA